MRQVMPYPSITLNNKKFVIPLIGNLGGTVLELKDDWLVKLIKILKLPKDTNIIDVGVNLGQSLMAVRSCCDNKCWGFEPNPDCLFYIKSLIAVNKLSDIDLIPVGLSLKNDVVKFYTSKIGDGAATILKDLRPKLATSASYVPVFRFDDLEIDIENIALVKIDVEGAEKEVIFGMKEAIKKHQPAIVCEILDCDLDADVQKVQQRATDIIDLMKQLSYKIYRVIHRENELNFEPIESVKIVMYNKTSPELNDYVFIPEKMNFSHGSRL